MYVLHALHGLHALNGQVGFMKNYQNLLIAAVLALAMASLGIAMDGAPDDITVMQLVADEVAALESGK